MTLKKALSAVKNAKAALEKLEADQDKIKKGAKIAGISLGVLGIAAGIFLLVKALKKKAAAKAAVKEAAEAAPADEDIAGEAADSADTGTELPAQEPAEAPVLYTDFSTTVAELKKKVGGQDA